MSGNIIWWIGFVHLVTYTVVGGFILLTMATVKAHMWFKVMGRIIQWHAARIRWERRHENGLSDTEWKRGDPQP